MLYLQKNWRNWLKNLYKLLKENIIPELHRTTKHCSFIVHAISIWWREYEIWLSGSKRRTKKNLSVDRAVWYWKWAKVMNLQLVHKFFFPNQGFSTWNKHILDFGKELRESERNKFNSINIIWVQRLLTIHVSWQWTSNELWLSGLASTMVKHVENLEGWDGAKTRKI